MHLDWERLSLSGYFEALEAHNEAHADPNAAPSKGPADPERLRKVMEARRESGKAKGTKG